MSYNAPEINNVQSAKRAVRCALSYLNKLLTALDTVPTHHFAWENAYIEFNTHDNNFNVSYHQYPEKKSNLIKEAKGKIERLKELQKIIILGHSKKGLKSRILDAIRSFCQSLADFDKKCEAATHSEEKFTKPIAPYTEIEKLKLQIQASQDQLQTKIDESQLPVISTGGIEVSQKQYTNEIRPIDLLMLAGISALSDPVDDGLSDAAKYINSLDQYQGEKSSTNEEYLLILTKAGRGLLKATSALEKLPNSTSGGVRDVHTCCRNLNRLLTLSTHYQSTYKALFTMNNTKEATHTQETCTFL